MTKRIIRDIPLNRVEGGLEIRVELENNRIIDAWSSGPMFRGFENLLVGRGALDGMAITPRICGICSTPHLMAATRALDQISGVTLPGSAIRQRNVALIVEYCQSDVRQSVLMFLPDFATAHYAAHPLYAEAVKRYAPMVGERCIDVAGQTKILLEIIALLGGHWPHSSFMAPGGVTHFPSLSELYLCRIILKHHCRWYEHRVLGSTLERWLAVQNAAELDTWLSAHPDGDVGFFLRFARSAGLHTLGKGHGHFVSYGSMELPRDTAVSIRGDERRLITSGFVFKDGPVLPFDQTRVEEHVASSWYADYQGGRHPFDGETDPSTPGADGKKYSWSKAPRYADQPAETGPLAERIVAGNPLFCDLLRHDGVNLVTRQLARLTRPATLLPAMETWLNELILHSERPYYEPIAPIQDGRGFGLIEAARGALGHWVEIRDGRIARYRIVTPTAWNGSPRDFNGVRGPWEEALIGTPVADINNPVEAEHVVRSFDPCQVCKVHVVGNDRAALRC